MNSDTHDRYADFANLIIGDLQLTGGSSRNGAMRPPTAGFMVGGVVKETVLPAGLIRADVEDFISRPDVQAALRSQFNYVGAWLNQETDQVHLDVSHVYPSESLAVKVASQRGELAIWDVVNKREISTK